MSGKGNIWIKGEDRYLGMFFTEACHEFRGYSIYDGSDVTREAIARERQLVEDGLVDPGSAPDADKPRARADLTVEFRNGWISLRRGVQRKRVDIPDLAHFSEIEALFDTVFRIMRRMLHSA